MEKKLFQPHYDWEFKRQVVEEYLLTGCSKMFLLRKYNIQFKSAIQTWMRVLGYKDPGRLIQKFNFGQIIFPSVTKQKNSLTESEELQKRIKDWSVSFRMRNSDLKRMPECLKRLKRN
jgi:hypothetical protein